MELFQFALEETPPMGEMFEQRLIVHVARRLTSADDMPDPSDQLDYRILRTRHTRPERLLVKYFGHGITKHWRFQMENRLSIARTESQDSDVRCAL